MTRPAQLLLKLCEWAGYARVPSALPSRDRTWLDTAVDELSELDRHREMETRLFMLTWM